MTTAVCFKCGELKFGAFSPCLRCGALPKTEDDVAWSVGMSDHFHDLETLEQMGELVRSGNPPVLAEEARVEMIRQLHATGTFEKLKEMWKSKPMDDWAVGER